MKKTTLPTIRLQEETKENMQSAIKKYNKGSLTKLSMQEFRRLSYELFAQIILQNKLKEIPVRFE